MHQNLVREKFEEFKKAGLSNREALKRLKEDLLEAIKGEIQDKTEEHKKLKARIERTINELKSEKPPE